VNESELLKKILPVFHIASDVTVPPGDDCAMLEFGGKYLLAAADQLISNVHYLYDTAPELVAAKLLKRNLSDIAAMGGIPRWALLTLAVKGRSDEWLERFFAGLEDCAEKYNTAIVGGDLAGLPNDLDCASLTILGEAEPDKVCLRKNGQVGDHIMVTGQLGDTFYTQHHLNFIPRLKEGRFLAENGLTRCMMDISDGIASDLPKLLEQSGKGAVVALEKLPCCNGCTVEHALSDGEDYELLFTVAPEKVDLLYKLWNFDVPLSCIGKITEDKGLIYTLNGKAIDNLEITGYEHFNA